MAKKLVIYRGSVHDIALVGGNNDSDTTYNFVRQANQGEVSLVKQQQAGEQNLESSPRFTVCLPYSTIHDCVFALEVIPFAVETTSSGVRQVKFE
ncbi:MAG: hypothetical protein Sylvanvirus6_27 [Sylvanvirus sp.]|uniref:Uncharacterized protein n=1 Tax=Sylvanvirus sp. TaxID=2487774 RepID=A0A3G5AHQ4_9VIRU|nr:MAG: hypothetical protein Sylvanvirus6_27 [Sylvanvirus sp.]